MNCRNGADFIREALDSLLAQTFDNWELIAWDDGSTDETLDILRGYDDDRFRIVAALKGKTLASVRRAAIAECHGEWIAFLDQDDIWLPEKLELQMSEAAACLSLAMIYGRALRFGPNRKLKEYDHRHAWTELPQGDIFVRLFEDSCYICMSTVVIRASLLQTLNAYPEEVRLTPDYYLYLTLCRSGFVRAIQRPVCLYRWHAENVSRQNGHEVHAECVFLVKHFSDGLDAALVKRRLRVHQTLIAFAQMSSLRTLLHGVVRLFRFGSVAYLASRPFVRLGRTMKMFAVRPYWKESNSALTISSMLSQAHAKTDRLRDPASALRYPAQFPVLGSQISVSSFGDAVEFLNKLVCQGDGGFMSNANAYSIMLARDNAAFRSCLAKAAYVTADGMPIVWMLKAFRQSAERVHGDDLLFACCERFPHWRHFLLGGRGGQAEQVASALRLRFPGICIVGARSTPVRPVTDAETVSILCDIAESGATMVWVGMGTPAQDLWMAAAAKRVKAVMAGVGSAFDLLAGHSKPAPAWMKRNGLQWLFRLVQEPRRLLFRYCYYNSRFLLLALVALSRSPKSNPRLPGQDRSVGVESR